MFDINKKIKQNLLNRENFKVSLPVLNVDIKPKGFIKVSLQDSSIKNIYRWQPADSFRFFLDKDTDGVDRMKNNRKLTAVKSLNSLDFYLFDHPGLALQSILKLNVGDNVTISGLKQEWAIGDLAKKFVFFVDKTSLPALSSILESLNSDQKENAYIFVDTSGLENNSIKYFIDSNSVNKVNLAKGFQNLLSDFNSLNFIEQNINTQIWIAGEAREAALLKKELKNSNNFSIKAKGYWKNGLTMEEFRKEKISSKE